MTSTTAVHAHSPSAGQPGASARRSRRGRRGGLLDRPWPAHWPLSLLVLGYPLWWVLGLATTMPVLLAVPLAAQLIRRRDLPLPRGFGWWLLFLAWVCLGVLVLSVDAPGAVSGGDPTRLLVFGYWLSWYIAITVWMLWLLDTARGRLPDTTVYRLVGGLLAVALFGGVLGMLAPDLEFRSAIEFLLPQSLRSNGFVASVVHPDVADVPDILGRPEPRPKAPFAFANTWGSVVSLSLLFAVAALVRSGPRARVAWIALLLLAPAPVIFSLNRGLWASLALGAAGLVALLAIRGHYRLLTGLAALGALCVLVLAQTPLAGVPAERLANPHSNDRRAELTETTVDSVTRGSPLVGFGSTRDVEGSFSSVAGADTPECPSCGVPPLGTQGQAWLLLFAQGWVGLFLFGAFMVGALWRSVRCRTLNETLCTFALAFLGLQVFVYDTLGLPLLVVFLAIGLVAREQRDATGLARQPSTRRLMERVRPAVVPGLVLVILGGTGGLAYGLLRHEPEWSATTRVLLLPLPDSLPGTASEPGPGDGPGTMTVDTEAALTRAAPVRLLGEDTTNRDGPLQVTAEPSTRVLEITVTGSDPDEVQAASREAVTAWSQLRSRQLSKERVGLLERFERLARRLRSADGIGPTGEALRDSTLPADRFIGAAVASISSNPISPGEVITADPAVRNPPEIAVPVASGLGLGLLVAALLTRRRGVSRPWRRRT